MSLRSSPAGWSRPWHWSRGLNCLSLTVNTPFFISADFFFSACRRRRTVLLSLSSTPPLSLFYCDLFIFGLCFVPLVCFSFVGAASVSKLCGETLGCLVFLSAGLVLEKWRRTKRWSTLPSRAVLPQAARCPLSWPATAPSPGPPCCRPPNPRWFCSLSLSPFLRVFFSLSLDLFYLSSFLSFFFNQSCI